MKKVKSKLPDKQCELFSPGKYVLFCPSDELPIPPGWESPRKFEEVIFASRYDRLNAFEKHKLVPLDVSVRFPNEWKPVRTVQLKEERLPKHGFPGKELRIELMDGRVFNFPYNKKESINAFAVKVRPGELLGAYE